jgi:DNA-binding PadR family transcriptional regulator
VVVRLHTSIPLIIGIATVNTTTFGWPRCRRSRELLPSARRAATTQVVAGVSAKHAVLGLVIERPGYGYQLAQRLQERCSTWGWEPTGVYRALETLSKEGSLRQQGEKGSSESGRAAPRLIYRATHVGEERFQAWMSERSKPRPQRQDLDLKLLFAGPPDIPVLLEQIGCEEQTCVRELTALANALEDSQRMRPTTLRDVVRKLHRERDALVLEARVRWLGNARLTLTELAEARSPGTRT